MMPRRTAAAPDRDSGPSEAWEERGGPSIESAAPPTSAFSASTAPAVAAAGIENHPASDDAPVPLAQALAAYDEAEKGNKRGVEEIESLGGGVPVPIAMMDTSYDRAEKGVEIVDDGEAPVSPGHAVDDGSNLRRLKEKRAGDEGEENDDASPVAGSDLPRTSSHCNHNPEGRYAVGGRRWSECRKPAGGWCAPAIPRP